MKTVVLFFLSIVLLLISCEKSDDSEINDLSALQIRITNSSDYDYHEFIFEKKEFGYIQKRSSTSYVDCDTIYQDLAFIQLKIDDVTFTLQPIDYDAPQITEGKYTYTIDVLDFENKILSLKTHVDN